MTSDERTQGGRNPRRHRNASAAITSFIATRTGMTTGSATSATRSGAPDQARRTCDKVWRSGPGETNGHPGTLKTLPECPKCEGTDPARDQGMPPITMAERDGPYKAMSDGKGAACPKCAKTDTKRFYNGGRFQKWSCDRCASRWTVIREGPSANRVVDAPLELDEKGFLEAFKKPEEPRTTDYCRRCHTSPESGDHSLGTCEYIDPRTHGELTVLDGHFRPDGQLCSQRSLVNGRTTGVLSEARTCVLCGWDGREAKCSCYRGGLEVGQHYVGCPVTFGKSCSCWTTNGDVGCPIHGTSKSGAVVSTYTTTDATGRS